MARKLRFFRDQMLKAGVTPATRSASEDDLDVDSLEVWMLIVYSETLIFSMSYGHMY